MRPYLWLLTIICAGCSTVSKSPPPLPDLNPAHAVLIAPSIKSFVATSKAQPLSVISPPGSITVVPQGARVQWNAVESTDIETVNGYNVYYGTETRFDDDGTWPSFYPNVINLTNVTNCSVVGLRGATTYYFSVTEVDQNGIESDFSSEATYATPLVLDIQFVFTQPVTNVVLQSSTDLNQWNDMAATSTNGIWRLTPDPSLPAMFYRARQ